MVDDPYVFGSITAANALSDIYAMGAKPLLALNIIGFPCKELSLDVLVEILRGGADKVKEAGALMVGGHTIEDKEPKYGLAVTGLVHPDKVIKNAGALPGDALILTKPLGTGIIVTAVKGGLADDQTYASAIILMETLNDQASRVMVEAGAHACTDITGFGLLGHLYEMTAASGVGALINLSQIPVLEQVRELASLGLIPAGAYRNLDYLEKKLQWDSSIDETDKLILTDPQTSGGLLMAIPGEKTAATLAALRDAGVAAAKIGKIISRDEPCITIGR
ncbi:MAG: Selenide, water dikinase [Firmicutes bacterium ADurb.Bin456]|nr:MAG: Selenide, water dikinase [Firmicutes bacterium ADurb.Bin456]